MNTLPPLIVLAGPFGPILSILGTVVVVLTARGVWMAARPGDVPATVIREQVNALLFWGTAASILGFLGQCQATYSALKAILGATEISPYVIAEGFVISFLPALMGFGILAFALVAWACLRFLPRPVLKAPPIFCLLLFALPLVGCGQLSSQGPRDLTEGVWVLRSDPNHFLWEFSSALPPSNAPAGAPGGAAAEPPNAAIQCVVHDVMNGLEYMETPCESASFDGERLALTMVSTGVSPKSRCLSCNNKPAFFRSPP
jgi:hypothetical protein